METEEASEDMHRRHRPANCRDVEMFKGDRRVVFRGRCCGPAGGGAFPGMHQQTPRKRARPIQEFGLRSGPASMDRQANTVMGR